MSTPFAIRQLAKKLRLEASVKPKLTKFFKEIGRTIRPVFNSTGRMPSLEPFKENLVEILTKHYDRTSKAFQGDVAPSLTKDMAVALEIKLNEAEEVVDEQSEIIDEALLGIIAVRASRQAQFILDTTEKELNESEERIIIAAAKEGETLTQAQVGKKVADDFNSKIPGRVGGISTLETQAMAEETKLTEADTIAEAGAVVGGISAAIATKKTWNTILDQVTRSSHAAADLQVRRLGQPFTVQGQLLKVPGDTSLGATLDNVMECRCSASYRLGAS